MENDITVFVGLDVHKDSIAIAVAYAGREAPRFVGTVGPALPELLKTLRTGGAIGLLPDQVPSAGDGIWTTFFGRPAYTMTLPAKLHQMSNAQIVLAYAERLSFGRGFAVHFVRFDERLAGTPEQQAHIINAAMEQLIARCPSQYFWSYNRYKGEPLSSSLAGEAA